MARTKIAATVCHQNAGRAQPAGTAVDQANGMFLAASDLESETPPVQGGQRMLFLEVFNTDTSDHHILIRKGANPPSFRALLGDLSVLVSHSSTVPFFIGPLESARFTQADGTVNVDFDASFAGTIYAYVLDKSI